MDARRAWRGRGIPTHLLHTMAMTTTAMRKTRAAAEEPTMSGSFSWMLVWYSAGEEAHAVFSAWRWEPQQPSALQGLPGSQALFLLLTESLSHAQLENWLSLAHKLPWTCP